MSANLYELLEVSQSASQETIAAAYKRGHAHLAARISGFEGADADTLERITALREAFSTLSDPERRREYDLRLSNRGGRLPGIAGEALRLLKPLVLVSLAAAFGLGYARLHADREEQKRIAAEARMADLQLQKERAEQKKAIQAGLDRRRDEAMERFNRQLGREDRQQSGMPPPANSRS
jgi:curved DNA-binding protein CbpA